MTDFDNKLMNIKADMQIKAEKHRTSGAGDIGRLILAGVITMGAIIAYVWLDHGSLPPALRLLGLLAGLVVALSVAAFTGPGRRVRHYMVESQFEIRKIVWPTHDETLKVTAIIIAVTIVLSLLLGLIDLVLKSVILDWLLKLG